MAETISNVINFETDLRPYFNFELSKVFDSGEFLYRAIPPHESYTIAIKLSDTDKMTNDNGVLNEWYEIGTEVRSL